ncbi:pirin isoform X3 [Manis pentadactyla]|uniref:pirin isoform X3 n=1 Tax=Manis pentadactyla TaxID=143292 RepID=UPI00255C4076|nr:pirin isoform X3 [Manis pentadactyla]
MASSKKVTLSVLSREQSEGVGARVRRSIGRPELKNLDPFLLFDEFKGGRPGGFPDHPHRGFETVSYLLEGGSMAHEDFCGHIGQMNPGDLQSKIYTRTPTLYLDFKLDQGAKHSQPIPKELRFVMDAVCHQIMFFYFLQTYIHKGQGTGCKNYDTALQWKAGFPEDESFLYVLTWTAMQTQASRWTSFIYTICGNVHIGPDDAQQKIEPHHTAVLGEGNSVQVENKDPERSHFVLIAGEPLKEPVVQHGPFVMNTNEEISQAILDFRNAKNGFERAKTWKSKIGN